MRFWLLVAVTLLEGCRGCRSEQATVLDGSAVTPPSSSAHVPAPPTTGVDLGDEIVPTKERKPLANGKHCLGAAPHTPASAYDREHNHVVHSHDGLAWVWDETEATGPGEPENAWLCFQRGSSGKVLLTSRPSDAGVQNELNDFSDFVWSRDDRVVFFATSAWVVTTAAHGVEVATGKEFFITDGNIIEELDRGPYKGSLYASHYRIDEDHPIGSPLYTGRGVVNDIIDWHGKRLAKVPQSEDNKKEYDRVLGL